MSELQEKNNVDLMLPRTSISDIRAYKKCRVLWHFTSRLRMNYGTSQSPLYLLRGSAWHRTLEKFYAGEDILTAFTDSLDAVVREHFEQGTTYLREEIESERDLGFAVLSMYPEWSSDNDDFEVLKSEQKTVIPLIADKLNFTFIADQIIRKNDGYWIHDFKTTSVMPSDSGFLEYDEQLISYLKACELKYGVPFKGAIFTYILTKMPTQPEQLKNGELTKRKNLASTPGVYLKRIYELGLDKNDYRDVLKRLKESAMLRYFRRFAVIIDQREVDWLWKQNEAVGAEMLRPETVIYPNGHRFNCEKCVFGEPCKVMRMNGDYLTFLDKSENYRLNPESELTEDNI